MRDARNRCLVLVATGVLVLCAQIIAGAQEPSSQTPEEVSLGTAPATQEANPQRGAAGRREAQLEDFGVAPGARFLVRLEDELSTGETHQNQRFTVMTLEPLEAGKGNYLPAGAKISGHVSRIEPAGVVGRAKIWLTFDEVHTKFGKLPIVAEVVSVPGDHSVKSGTAQEGLIEAHRSTERDAGRAAAEGAAMGAAKGVRDKNKKEIGEAAVTGAIAAYLMESGRGHELDLPKGAKLELELDRVLYLVKQ